MADALRIAVASLIHGESEGGCFLHKPEAEQANDLKRIVPIHGDPDVAEPFQLGQVLRLSESLGIERCGRASGYRVSANSANAVQCGLSQN